MCSSDLQAFLKRFAPLDTTEAVRDALKALKQGKNAVAEYISYFNQYMGQTGWSDTDHHTRFYDGLNEQLKDNLAISDHPITQLQELKAAAQILDQCMRQCEAEKKGRTYHTTSQAPSKDPNAMEVDASRQKEERNRRTYMAFMKGNVMDAEVPITQRKMDSTHGTYAATVRKWATDPPSVFQSIWASRSQQKLLHRKKPQRHQVAKRRLLLPPHKTRRPKIVRDKQTYWPSLWRK